MTDLIDEVKASFDRTREDHDEGRGPVTVIRPGDEELAPGFNAMRTYYGERLLAIMRRSYRHFAGSTLPTDADQLVELTSPILLRYLLAVSFEAFADGVMIGQQEDQLVKMCTHFNTLEHIFDEEGFRESSRLMAHGFAEDAEVLAYFNEYLGEGVGHLSHVTGFAHREVNPGKVWDVWLLIGTATTAAAYLAGHKMGTSWQERDVLDGIEIATQGDENGPEGAEQADQ